MTPASTLARGNRRGRLHRLALALAISAAALCVRALLDPLFGSQHSYVTSFVAVAVTAFLAGPGAPTLVALVVTYVASSWFFSEPRYSLALPTLAHQLSALSYFGAGLLINALAGRAERARVRADDAAAALADEHARLEAELAERRKAEEALRAANERLRDADQAKDEFLAMLSHELRNPLAPIRNALHVLGRVDPASEQGRHARAIVERQVRHLGRLVEDLVDVSRIARRKLGLTLSRVDLVDVARRAAEDYRAVVEHRGARLELEVPDEPIAVDGDATRLGQALGNLLHNAGKFTRAGDRVILSLRRDGDAAEVAVRDTGAGIDPALLPRVFEPFVQGERTLARSEGGLGLGLALVRAIAELHGGSARVESAGAGRGATFTVRLPTAGELAAEPARPEAPPAPRRRRVLVVDDNVDAAASLAELVQLFGHATEIAHDGPSALALARAHAPDVVLCDIGLPGMDGYAVARALRGEVGNGIRLVALSGYAQPRDLRAAAAAGFDAHMAKPPDPRELERLLA